MLETSKQTIALDTLYEVQSILSDLDARKEGSRRITPQGGNVNLYHSDSTTQPANLAAMNLAAYDTAFSESRPLDTMTTYIACTGTATEVYITGFELLELGAIS